MVNIGDVKFSPTGPFQQYNLGIGDFTGLTQAMYPCNFEFKADLMEAQRACAKYGAIGFGTANWAESEAVKASVGRAFVVYGLANGSISLPMVLQRLSPQGSSSPLAVFYARV